MQIFEKQLFNYFFSSIKVKEMKWRSLLKSKRQIGIIIVLTFTANVIMLYASLPFLLPGEQSHSYQKSLSKYDRQIFTNMEVNLTVNALEKEQKAIQNHIKSSKFSKNKGQMNFIPLSRTKFSKTKEGQMDFKSAGQTEGRNDVQPPNGVQFHANNQHVLEEINALANEKAGKVYHMYDDDVAVDAGIVAENLVQNNSPGIPKTFDENYIKYFWNHPEFRAKDNNIKVKTKEKQDISNETTELKNKKGYVKDKLNIRNTRQEVPKDSDKKNNFNHKVNVDQPKGKTYLTMYPARGKLGNQMFQLASLLGIADRGNFTPFLQMSQFELEEVFRFPKTFSRVIDTSTFKMFTENNYTQDVSLKLCRNLNSRMNWSLDGWFQSFKYFNDVSEQVRHYLRFKKDVLRTAQEFIQKSVPVGHTSVAIHVRRGDFISAYEMKLGRVEVPPGK